MCGGRAVCGLLIAILLMAGGGCAGKNATVASAFPQESAAAPWITDDAVWSGSLAQAAASRGPDAEEWRLFHPLQVWLAVYRHEDKPGRKLTVRAFAFESPRAAREAFEHFRPTDARQFNAGDGGCWTGIGVLFVWGRLVFDIFGSEASWQSDVQSARLTGYIEKHMPAGLPDAPR